MEYVIDSDDADDNASRQTIQALYDRANGARHCSILRVVTPPGGGSPAGLHTHDVDQLFYVITGEMAVEIGGNRYNARAGSLVIFPANVPHRNWNVGQSPLTHLSIAAPLPAADEPFAKPVDQSHSVPQ